MSIAVLLSIKPEFALSIFSGEKTYEFRKTIFKDKSINKVYVYASSPISMVIGTFYIEEIIQDHPKAIWEETCYGAGITEEFFFKYFSGRELGYALKVEKALLFDKPQKLEGMFGLQHPPQSFRYVSCKRTNYRMKEDRTSAIAPPLPLMRTLCIHKGQSKMNQQYHLDLEKYSLQKFKRSLQKRNMIPSRVILKENIEERLNILDINGIKTLKALIDVLKTKKKIEDFSKKTGLSTEYLTILKREAGSYLPNPINLKKFSGIDTKTIEALEKIGIKSTKQFFDKVNIGKGTDLISQKTGVSADKLNELASLSDLARLYGVGPVFAQIIYNAGINSVESFIKCSAKEFIKIYENKTKKKADFNENDINFSIDLAKELTTS
ncbi:MAG: DUF4332 domain-containing protein [Desulfobacteraceae bacterium]|nr:DUF4332 domain-containing protein [Desulfobacteraceae bacterium]